MASFPQPATVEGSTRWSPTPLNEWEKAHGLDLPPLTGLVSVRHLALRYGVSPSTVWRWAQKARKEATTSRRSA